MTEMEKKGANQQKTVRAKTTTLSEIGYYGNCAFLSSPLVHLELHIFV